MEYIHLYTVYQHGKCCCRTRKMTPNTPNASNTHSNIFLLDTFLHLLFCFFFQTRVISVTQVLSYLLCTNSLSLLHYQSHFLQYLHSPLTHTQTHTHLHAQMCVLICARTHSLVKCKTAVLRQIDKCVRFPREWRWHTRSRSHATSAYSPAMQHTRTHTLSHTHTLTYAVLEM